MHSRTLQPTDAQCVRIMDSWSPAANAIEYKWMTFFEVAFHIKSIYLGSPTPEVETAWDLLIPGTRLKETMVSRDSTVVLLIRDTCRSPNFHT